MKLSICGSTGTPLCQINSLREGFLELGHLHVDEISNRDVSFVFVGNSPYESYLSNIGKKLIFNVLDCPTWCKEWPQIRAKWTEQLQQCDRVTCISQTVKRQLKEYCNVNAEVIYYPMKPVVYTGKKTYPYRAAMIGRLCDPEKFASSAIHALIRAGFNEDEVAMVGPEYPGWGHRCGLLTDAALNELYNSVDYILMLDRGCGIGLPAIEAACCGAIPIVAPHCMTFDEFWAESPLGLHYQILNSPNDVAMLIRSLEDNPTWKAEVKQDLLGYAALKFRPKFEAKAVASRIIETYQSI